MYERVNPVSVLGAEYRVDIAMLRVRNCLLALLAFFAVFVLAAGLKVTTKPVIVVSIPPEKYFVERLAGDSVVVEVLLPPGANPHNYEPTISKLKTVFQAQAYFALGHPDLAFEDQLVKRIAKENKRLEVVKVSEGFSLDEDDPHFWNSVNAGRVMARIMARTLAELLPENKAEINTRLEELERQLAALELRLRQLFEMDRGARFLVTHPAFGYFADEFGLVQIAIEHHGKEPGAFRTEQLLQKAKKEGFKFIFIGPQSPRRSADVIAQEIGAEIVVIDPLAEDWMDNMLTIGKAIKRGLVK